MSILALTSCLLDVLPFCFGWLLDSFAVGHLRFAYICFNTKLALHAVYQDLEVELAHTGDKGLHSFGVCADLKGWVFIGKLLHRHAHFLLVGLGSRLNTK